MPIDLTRYDPSNLSADDIRSLVESMYSTLDANEKILQLFAEADRIFSGRCLQSLLGDSNLEVVGNAAEVFVFFQGQKSIPAIAKLLEHADDRIRGAMCTILARVPSAEAEALLVRRLQSDPSGNVRYCAADALRDIGGPSAIETLRQTAATDTGENFERRSVSGCAQQAIEDISEREGIREQIGAALTDADLTTLNPRKEGYVSISVGLSPRCKNTDRLEEGEWSRLLPRRLAEELSAIGMICGLPAPLGSLLRQISFSESYIDSALKTARSQHIESAVWVTAQFKFAYSPLKLRKKIKPECPAPFFLGVFFRFVVSGASIGAYHGIEAKVPR